MYCPTSCQLVVSGPQIRPELEIAYRFLSPSTAAPEIDGRSCAPTCPRIPELDALDFSPVAREINHPSLSAFSESITNAELHIASVVEVDDHAFEIDSAALYPQLKRGKRPAVLYVYLVVIFLAIYVCLAEMLPAAPLRV